MDIQSMSFSEMPTDPEERGITISLSNNEYSGSKCIWTYA
jgi:hypothetical protein